MSPNDRQQLIDAAIAVRGNAYAPYSRFSVGAAIMTSDGRIFTGCNVESASYGLTICAERVAATSAVAAGSREFSELAIATSGASAPCGACRQFLAEFCGNLKILFVDAEHLDAVRETTLADLLPDQFRLQNGI